MKRIPKHIINNLSITAIIICMGFFLTQIFLDARWKNEQTVIQSDVIGYYSYLPSAFIYKDLSLNYVRTDQGDKKYLVMYDITPQGKRFIRYSLGQAVLYSPFFFLGHGFAHLLNYNTGGYSEPYKFFLLLSCMFYLTFGLLALRKLLIQYFPDYAVALSIIIMGFATNLQHYVTDEAAMTHAYSFSLIAIFLYLTDKWHKTPSFKISLYLGIIYGLFSLVRPFNGMMAIVFILYGITSFSSFKDRIVFFYNKYYLILTIVLVVFIIWIPQLLYWKYVSGNFLFYSYDLSGGKFFFNQPKILKGLFSYRKGWFTYNPVMLLVLPGLFFINRYFKGFRIGFLIFISVFIYCLFSWWSWWEGGGLSIRMMVDIYAIMAFPLTAAIATIIKMRNQIIRYCLLLVVAFFCLTGFIFNRQYKKGIIHYDGMTKEAFWACFYKFKVTPSYYDLICRPDYALARKGIYICTHELGQYKDMKNPPKKKF